MTRARRPQDSHITPMLGGKDYRNPVRYLCEAMQACCVALWEARATADPRSMDWIDPAPPISIGSGSNPGRSIQSRSIVAPVRARSPLRRSTPQRSAQTGRHRDGYAPSLLAVCDRGTSQPLPIRLVLPKPVPPSAGKPPPSSRSPRHEHSGRRRRRHGGSDGCRIRQLQAYILRQ